MAEIKFIELKPLNSQQTIVNILRDRKYCFERVSVYDNNLFYCMIKCPKTNIFKDAVYRMFKWAGAKEPPVNHTMTPLCLTICNCIESSFVEPMVFTQDDVKSIVSDVPENYEGEMKL